MPTEFEDLTDDEFTSFMNGLSDKDKAKYNKMTPEQQRTVRQGHKQTLKYNAAEAARTAPNREASAAALANNGIVQDTLRGGSEQNKAGKPVSTGLGSVEGGDKPLGERQQELADPTPANVEEDIYVTPTKPGQQEQAKEEAKKDPQTRWKMKSIMQAYYDGDFGQPGSPEAKANRNYLLADTVSTFLRNTGHNTSEDSIWGRRNKEMASSAIEGEKTGVQGSDADFKARLNELQIKAQNLANWNVEDNRRLAAMVESTLYDKNGRLRYKPDSKTFKDLTQQSQSLRYSNSVNNSMINQLLQWIAHSVGF